MYEFTNTCKVFACFIFSNSVFATDMATQWRALLARVICEFVRWFASSLPASQSLVRQNLAVTVRDVLKWIAFVNSTLCTTDSPITSLAHGCALAFLDALPNASPLKTGALECLQALLSSSTLPTQSSNLNMVSILAPPTSVHHSEDLSALHIGPFSLPVCDPDAVRKTLTSCESVYSFECPTTALNLMRLSRALQLFSGSPSSSSAATGASAILLEGSPGVGKTSLVLELGRALGVRVLRVNLSEQTDVSDLVGRDLPRPATNECSPTATDDASLCSNASRVSLSGEFEWCDGPLLTALKQGAWILFDEVRYLLKIFSIMQMKSYNAILHVHETHYIHYSMLHRIIRNYRNRGLY